MARSPDGPVCESCKRRLGRDDPWIALDGGIVWCADCWNKQFVGAPGQPAGDPLHPPAGHATAQAAEDTFVLLELTEDQHAAPAVGPATGAQAPSVGPRPLSAAPGAPAPVRGVPPAPPAPVPPPGIAPARTCGLAVASFIVSMCGLVALCLGPVLGAVAIILGIMALGATSRDPALRGRGLAIAGLLTGIVEAIGWIVVLAVLAMTGAIRDFL